MKYMIHSCNSRQWYVDRFLIPSMTAQGIKEEDIIVFQDVTGLGNLKAFIKSLKYLDEEDTTWHLQDDIIISQYFKGKTEAFTNGVVCGFCSRYDKMKKAGIVSVQDMWYSFPCIHIPNKLAKEFLKWFYYTIQNTDAYKHHLQENKYDDLFFMDFLKATYPSMKITHLIPNIVNHIDYLLGGSTVNIRKDTNKVTSMFWYEPELLEDIERRLQYGR